MLTTGNQLKAARSMLNMEQSELAKLVGVNINTIRNMENSGPSPIAGRSQTVQAVQRQLEREGIEFLNHGRPGVQMSGDVKPRARLFRIGVVPEKRHVFVIVNYAGDRQNAFVTYEALGASTDEEAASLFNERKGQILAELVRRVDAGEKMGPKDRALVETLPELDGE
jgi:transcriptional regulator with XRE-family HTH domain